MERNGINKHQRLEGYMHEPKERTVADNVCLSMRFAHNAYAWPILFHATLRDKAKSPTVSL